MLLLLRSSRAFTQSQSQFQTCNSLSNFCFSRFFASQKRAQSSPLLAATAATLPGQAPSRAPNIQSSIRSIESATSLDVAFEVYASVDHTNHSSMRLYQSIISACRRLKQPNQALGVWRDIEAIGERFTPDAILFSSFVLACREARNPTPAIDAFRKLCKEKARSFHADRGVYLSMAMLVRDTKCSIVIPELIDNALQQNIVLDQVILGIMTLSVMQDSNWQAAAYIVSRATSDEVRQRSSLQLNTVICNQLMQTFRSAHRMLDAANVFFKLMVGNGDTVNTLQKISPSAATYRLLLSGCTEERLFHLGLRIYAHMIRENDQNIFADLSVFASVLRLLSKVGRVDAMLSLWKSNALLLPSTTTTEITTATNVPATMTTTMTRKQSTNAVVKDVLCWTALIDGLGDHGRAAEALQFFRQMTDEYHVKPDAHVYTAVLNACSHAGMVDSAVSLLHDMKKRGIDTNVYHRTALVDALGRKGLLDKAFHVVSTEQPASVVMWTTFLSACRVHQHVLYAERAVAAIETLVKKNGAKISDLTAARILLEQIYDRSGRVEDRLRLRALRKHTTPGITRIEIGGEVTSFTAHDTRVNTDPRLHLQLQQLAKDLDLAGHVPDLSVVDSLSSTTGALLTEDEKRWSLCTHSERIAIAYGMLHLPDEAPIYLYKNLRVCPDCHEATKIFSKIYRREIVFSDTNRFHHIKDGKCSCGDYW